MGTGCLLSTNGISQKTKPVKPLAPVEVGRDGKLLYTTDSIGNRIPDFSYCGYMASEKPIPEVTVKVVVPLIKGDATLRIQSAIDYVASLPLDKNGFRGTILLERGTYQVEGFLTIAASGIVIRGSGTGSNGTVLYGAGTDRQTLIRIKGKNNKTTGKEIKITDEYVPVNAFMVHLTTTASLKVGDPIIIRRPSTKKWIEDLDMSTFGGGISSLGWKPGEKDLFFDRQIIAIEGNVVTINAPLTTALDSKYGGGTVASYQWTGRISQSGIENLDMESAFDKNNPKDEAHRWMAITLENVQDAWVRRVQFEHFAGSAVRVLESASRVTVEDCKSYSPVSEIGGERRYAFYTTGGQTLFQRCYSENGYHDFAVGYCAPGPNAFVQCESHLSNSFSGCIDSWASGVLFDVVNIDGNALRFGNREQDGQGAGWSAANSLYWNCSAARIDCYKPPTAQNWSFGSWAQFAGNGYWNGSNGSVNPRSFYYAQLTNRLNKNTNDLSQILKIETEASSSPTVKQAAELIALSVKTRIQLSEWIDSVASNNPISTEAKGIKTIDQFGIKKIESLHPYPVMSVQNGWVVRGKEVLTGTRSEVPWWSGGVQPAELKNAKPAITRFVPGRTGQGLTDDLDEMTDSLIAKNIIGLEQHYALWYDRRRDDHERIRRMDGEVWPPFYELPFARSGKELAWDGLSKYDLTQYNRWYWNRLKDYADLADKKGLVLINENFFQHNIIEAGAHYADFPWRTANNINNTGFPEPPPYAGDKRIFMAEQYYDESNTHRSAIQREYIRQCLTNFKDNNGVIQLIGDEFTGPLHFVKFWLGVIKEWEKETGKKQIIGLSVTKDVQDSILADPDYSSVVNLIDIRYWHYQFDGSVYAPPGGHNLAPRQWARLMNPKKSSFEQVYRAVRTYREKYPDKAVMYSGEGSDMGWAVLLAGGSLAAVPQLPVKMLEELSSMHVIDLPGNTKNTHVIGIEGKCYIIYSDSTSSIQLPVSNTQANFRVRYIDPKSGKLIGKEIKVKGKDLDTLGNNQDSHPGALILWISLM